MAGLIQRRLKRWRKWEGLTLDAVRQAVARQGVAVSLQSVSNYETEAEAAPRGDYLAALLRAFPDLSPEWLLIGDGMPSRAEEIERQLREHQRLPAAEPNGRAGLHAYLVSQYPDLRLLSAEVRTLFVSVLTRYALTGPDPHDLSRADEGLDLLSELAGDLLAYVRLPWHPMSHGFVSIGSETHDRQIEQFTVAVLNALDALLVPRRGGKPIQHLAGSPLRQLAQTKGTLTRPEIPGKESL